MGMSRKVVHSAWTQFMDMHSGGGTKLPPYQYIYIEAPEKEAEIIFFNRYGRNPHRVTCTCCGEDYSVTESASLREATAFNRGCDYAYFNPSGGEVAQNTAWVSGKGIRPGYTSGYVERGAGKSYRPFCSLAEYMERKDVLFIRANKIKPHERVGTLPAGGYVWQ